MHSMVTDVYNPSAETQPAAPADVVYDELPDGLIDIPSAAKLYDCDTGRLRMLVRRGTLISRGRLKAPAYGGGYLLVDRQELAEAMANPRARGRPKK